MLYELALALFFNVRHRVMILLSSGRKCYPSNLGNKHSYRNKLGIKEMLFTSVFQWSQAFFFFYILTPVKEIHLTINDVSWISYLFSFLVRYKITAPLTINSMLDLMNYVCRNNFKCFIIYFFSFDHRKSFMQLVLSTLYR